MDSPATPDSIEKAIAQPRKAYTARGLGLLTLSFSTLGVFFAFFLFFSTLISCAGVIYSDIGTSPLYVLNGIWPADGPVPPKEDVIGAISAIIWALTLMPFLKYVSTPYLQLEDSWLNIHSRSLFACASVPGREREEVSPYSKGCILPPTRTATVIGS
jgi:hypothetical protein